MALRTGYAVPMGSVDSTTDMSTRFANQVPFVLEVGARAVPNVFLGGYIGGSYGSGTDGHVAAHGLRLGGELLYHLAPDESSDPWLGYGCGYESISTESSGVSGIEYAHIMGGVDFRVSRVLDLGPFFDVSLGTYLHYYEDGAIDAGPMAGAIHAKAMHEWIAFGMRGTVSP
jgi:hypothetical protein